MVIEILLSLYSFRKGQASGLAIPSSVKEISDDPKTSCGFFRLFGLTLIVILNPFLNLTQLEIDFGFIPFNKLRKAMYSTS